MLIPSKRALTLVYGLAYGVLRAAGAPEYDPALKSVAEHEVEEVVEQVSALSHGPGAGLKFAAYEAPSTQAVANPALSGASAVTLSTNAGTSLAGTGAPQTS